MNSKEPICQVIALRAWKTVLDFDICPRVQGVDFAEVPDDETTLTFLLNLVTIETKRIKQSESYQIFIKYSTSQIPPKNSRGKGSQRKKTTDTFEADVDVSEESNSEPARKQTCNRRVIKKKVTISADDNIIPEPDIALERRPSCIAFIDTSSVSKNKSYDPSQKLKGVQTLTPEEQLAFDRIKALKESKKTSRIQPGTGGSSEGIDDYDDYDDNDDNDDDDDDNDDDDDDKSIDLEKTNDEETDDEFVHSEENVQDDDKESNVKETDDELVLADEQVNNNEDEEMTNAEDADTRNVLTPIPETPSVAHAITLLPPPTVSSISHLKEADNTTTLCALFISEIPSTVNTYLGSSMGDALQKVLHKHMKELIQKYPVRASWPTKEMNMRHGKECTKRKPLPVLTSPLSSSFSKQQSQEPVEKPVFEMASYDIEQTVDDMANDVDQPPDNSTQAKDKSLKKDWFTQPPRPLTPDPEWNKRQFV
ncbi:hypothetical protein Tco_1006478 [Tanacetum coccineum]|uniref:Uncharacterized protein n=1 Tax=Tanacetum coccineum TaxID=301880 RepID=A0ABQ5FHU9_9ASTR